MSSGPAHSTAPIPTAEPRAATVDLLAGGEVAFVRILRRIDDACRSILIRCFGWRDDETGAIVARHLVQAADRGVKVHILKDRVGMHYEYLEGTKQSFFHKELDAKTRVQTWFLMAAYREWGSLRQRANPLLGALLAHDNVTVVCDEKRFDHSKLYMFDDNALILGGMGIGDDYRWSNVDFMVEIAGRAPVARYVERDRGRVAFDPTRDLDFLIRSRRAPELDGRTLVENRLALIRGARRSLTIEMAYLGDRRCTDALADAVARGVTVTLLTAARANIIRDLNLRTCNQLLARTGAPANLRIFLHPRMVHGKAMVVDSHTVDIGSANFTPLSHEVYEEVNLYRRDPELAGAVEAAIEKDIEKSRPATERVPYRRVRMLVERAFVVHQTRKGKRRAVSAAAAAGAPARER